MQAAQFCFCHCFLVCCHSHLVRKFRKGPCWLRGWIEKWFEKNMLKKNGWHLCRAKQSWPSLYGCFFQFLLNCRVTKKRQVGIRSVLSWPWANCAVFMVDVMKLKTTMHALYSDWYEFILTCWALRTAGVPWSREVMRRAVPVLTWGTGLAFIFPSFSWKLHNSRFVLFALCKHLTSSQATGSSPKGFPGQLLKHTRPVLHGSWTFELVETSPYKCAKVRWSVRIWSSAL